MAENTALARVASQQIDIVPPALLASARRIDAIAGQASQFLASAEGFGAQLGIAHVIGLLRDALTPELMTPVMALQNTDLGFRCDKPYPVELVRDVVIEATIRGFRTTGNEFNIIAGRFYGAKNGFRRKVTTWPGLTDFKDTYDVPRLSTGGAVVKCRATWKVDGDVYSSGDLEFAVRLNAGMGADGAVGKAERKLLRRIHDRLSGNNTPDGDANEDTTIVVEERVGAPPQPTPPPAKSTTTQTTTTQTSAAPPRADGPSPLGQAALEHGEAQSRGRREPPVTDSRGAEFFGPSPEPKTSEQAPAATGEIAAATKPAPTKEPPQVEHPSQLAPAEGDTAASIIARLNEAERFAQVKALDGRMRVLGTVAINEVIDIYIAAVIKSFEAAEDKAELAAITTEIGRLNKDSWLTKEQYAKAKLERDLAAKRLGG